MRFKYTKGPSLGIDIFYNKVGSRVFISTSEPREIFDVLPEIIQYAELVNRNKEKVEEHGETCEE